MLLISLLPVCTVAQGLRFIGMEKTIEERTSYDVFGTSRKTFSDAYELSFQMMLYPQSDFGYILRVRDHKDPSTVWNVSYDGKGQDVEIRINEEARYSILCERISRDDLQYLQWYDISLKIDMQKDSVYLDIGDLHFCEYAKSDIPDEATPIISFGRSGHIIDVPSFAIRDLTVRECRHGGEYYHFPLNASSGNIVDDSTFDIQGQVTNPVWLIGESVKWKPVCTMRSHMVSSVGYDKFRKEFYLVNRDSLYIYGLRTGKSSRVRMGDDCPVTMKLGCSFISPADSCLYVYEPFGDVPEGSPTVAVYDRDNDDWKSLSNYRMSMCLHHHATFFLPDGRFGLFGGFGHLLYNGKFYCFDPDISGWTELWNDTQIAEMGDVIFPRYFASAGMNEDGTSLYVFGGMGNECGEQIVGRRYFYDLHKVDVSSGRVEKMWEMKPEGEPIVPVRNMLVSGNSFFVMCYPEYKTHSHLRLYRFSLTDGSYEILCDDIPINSDRITTNANLYYDEELNKLFVTVQEFAKNDIDSETSIYSLTYPPLSETESLWGMWIRRHRTAFAFIIGLLVCSVLCVLLLRVRRGRLCCDGSDARFYSSAKKCFVPKAHANAIFVFGDFKVIDPMRNDISNIFTGQQQTILFLLLKRYNENGISSKRLSSILWPDKDEDKGKNSRGVAINNLRKSLSHLEGLSVTFEDGRYKLKVEDGLWCDYLQLLPVLDGQSADVHDALCILANRGKFLSLVNDPVFDTFKEKVETKVLDFLHREIVKRFENREYNASVEIADMIVKVDPLDEAALKYSVWALKKLRRNEDARVRYSEFIAEYRAMYDQEYSITYKEL